MAIITKEDVKQFLRIDTDEDDTLITLEIDTAEEMLKNATGKEFDNTNPLAKTYCLLLVHHMYEERTFTAPKSEKISYITSGLILQLKYSYTESEEVTT